MTDLPIGINRAAMVQDPQGVHFIYICKSIVYVLLCVITFCQKETAEKPT